MAENKYKITFSNDSIIFSESDDNKNNVLYSTRFNELTNSFPYMWNGIEIPISKQGFINVSAMAERIKSHEFNINDLHEIDISNMIKTLNEDIRNGHFVDKECHKRFMAAYSLLKIELIGKYVLNNSPLFNLGRVIKITHIAVNEPNEKFNGFIATGNSISASGLHPSASQITLTDKIEKLYIINDDAAKEYEKMVNGYLQTILDIAVAALANSMD